MHGNVGGYKSLRYAPPGTMNYDSAASEAYNEERLRRSVVHRDVTNHLHQQRVAVLEGSPHQQLQPGTFADELRTARVGREVDAQRQHLDVGLHRRRRRLLLLASRVQQHLHHLQSTDSFT